MAVQLEFISIIVPIAKIEEKYPGGWAEFQSRIGGAMWHDEHLFRCGAMSPHDAEETVDFFKGYGFETLVTRDGRECWADLCVADELTGPTHPCDWLTFMPEERAVHLTGTAPGRVVGRE